MVVVGRIGSAFGIQGWVRIQSFTEDPDALLSYSPWCIRQRGQWVTLNIKNTKVQDGELLALLTDYPTREDVRTLANGDIGVDGQQLPDLEQDEYYWCDLIGLTVINQENLTLGTVEKLLETGANDVLVVRDKRRERLIPYVLGQFIINIDSENKIIQVDWDAEF